VNLQDTLLAYSEWLDGQGLVLGEEASRDPRTHQDLAGDFIADWQAKDRATLVGAE